LAEEGDRNLVFSYLEDRFGIPGKLFEGYLLFKRKTGWSLLKNSRFMTQAAQLKVAVTGLRAFQRINAFIKPTTRFIQLFGHLATKARMDIDAGQLARLSAGDRLPVDLGIGNGYVILFINGQSLGLGLLIDGKLHSQIPRKELNFLSP